MTNPLRHVPFALCALVLAACGQAAGGNGSNGPLQPEPDANGVINFEPVALEFSPQPNYLTASTEDATEVCGRYSFDTDATATALRISTFKNGFEGCSGDGENTYTFTLSPNDQVASASGGPVTDMDNIAVEPNRKYILKLCIKNSARCSKFDSSFLVAPAT